MSKAPDWTPDIPEDVLIALARARGLALDAESAAALRPQLQSLLARLAALARTLPPELAPPPGPLRPDGT